MSKLAARSTSIPGGVAVPRRPVGWRPALVTGLLGAVAFRAVAQAVAVISTMGSTAPARLIADPLSWAWPWVQFDARWYVAIAEVGYTRLSPVLGGTIPAGADVRLFGNGLYAYDGVAFPPLYPVLIRGVSILTRLHPAAAAMVVGALCLAAGLVAVHRLADMDHGPEVARATVLILLLFPAALFLAAPYAEPLLLMTLAWAFLCARTGRWWWSGIFLGAAALTKVYAVIFVAALAVEAFEAVPGRVALRRLVALTVPTAIAAAAWMVYLQARFGDPLRFLTVQGYWHHRLAPPWTSLAYAFATIYNDGRALELTSLALLTVMTVYAFRRLRRAYAVAMLLSLVGYTVTYNIVSVNRFLVALFPLFIALGLAWSRHTWVRVVLPAAFLPLSAFLLVGFAHGHWAG